MDRITLRGKVRLRGESPRAPLWRKMYGGLELPVAGFGLGLGPTQSGPVAEVDIAALSAVQAEHIIVFLARQSHDPPAVVRENLRDKGLRVYLHDDMDVILGAEELFAALSSAAHLAERNRGAHPWNITARVRQDSPRLGEWLRYLGGPAVPVTDALAATVELPPELGGEQAVYFVDTRALPEERLAPLVRFLAEKSGTPIETMRADIHEPRMAPIPAEDVLITTDARTLARAASQAVGRALERLGITFGSGEAVDA